MGELRWASREETVLIFIPFIVISDDMGRKETSVVFSGQIKGQPLWDKDNETREELGLREFAQQKKHLLGRK